MPDRSSPLPSKVAHRQSRSAFASLQANADRCLCSPFGSLTAGGAFRCCLDAANAPRYGVLAAMEDRRLLHAQAAPATFASFVCWRAGGRGMGARSRTRSDSVMAAGQSRGLHQPRKISSGALLAKKETSYGTSKQLIGHSFLDKSYSRLLLVALRGQEKETRNVPIHQGSKNFRQPVQFAVPQTPIAWS